MSGLSAITAARSATSPDTVRLKDATGVLRSEGPHTAAQVTPGLEILFDETSMKEASMSTPAVASRTGFELPSKGTIPFLGGRQ